MTSDRRFFSGDSLAQALNQAAQHFQMAPAEINYKLVEKRHGFLKVRRKVVIEVDGAAPGRPPSPTAPSTPPVTAPSIPPVAAPSASPVAASAAPPVAASSDPSAPASPFSPGAAPPAPPVADAPDSPAEPSATEPSPGSSIESPAPPPETPRRAPRRRSRRRVDLEGGGEAEADASQPASGAAEIELPAAPLPAKKRFPSARGEEAEAAGKALALILDLAGLELESEILQGEEELLVELWGSDQEILLRDRGRLLLAIQHLLPRAIRGLIGRSVGCRVDSDDFHMIREERLRDLAQRAADEVRHRGRPKTLEPMSPDERRIVHLTLADYPGVETESHGSGLFKRVMVRATRGQRSRDLD